MPRNLTPKPEEHPAAPEAPTPAATAAATAASNADTGWMATPVRALMRSTPVTANQDASIREVAVRMRDAKVSSVLLMDGDRLVGIVTDRDLRNRVLAEGLDTARPAIQVGTRDPITLPATAAAFEALLLMTERGIHHLPVVEGGRVLGMLTAGDLAQRQTASAIYLVGDISRQGDVAGLARASAQVAQLQRQLAANATPAGTSGRIITSITDAVTRRLLQLAHQQLGNAPVPYVWVAAGSQGRSEQTARSDQDNCMILDDAYDPQRDGEYFEALARFVCDGLNACGYVYCPGEMMAMTDQWRQPLARWQAYFDGWINRPEPKALMLTSVFFDLRAIAGDTALLERLRTQTLAQTRGNSLFLAHLAGNALQHRPALTWLGQLATESRGEHKGRIDLKHKGSVPVIDLARIFALAAGVPEVNTYDRLQAAARAGSLSDEAARDLTDALEVIGRIRLSHQARQTEAGIKPDNFVSPKELSSLDQRQLLEAFKVIQTLQSVLAQRYGGGSYK
jgi:CBS domain-containing protein